MPTKPSTAEALAFEIIAVRRRLRVLEMQEQISGGVVDHGTLLGLADDDHLQYLKEKLSGGTAAETPVHDHSGAAEAGTVDHGDLTGLAGDDHVHYILAVGTRPFSGPVEIDIAVGDPLIRFDIGGLPKWSMGVDDSAADSFKISPSQWLDLPFGGGALMLTAAGDMLLGGNGDLTTGGVVLSGGLEVTVAAGDPVVIFDLATVDKWTIGMDDDDADLFKINSGATLADPSDFEMDSSGNIETLGNLEVEGGIVSGARDQTPVDGTIMLHKAAGDPLVKFRLLASTRFVMGVDDSDGDKFKINSGIQLANPSDLELDAFGTLELMKDVHLGGGIVVGDVAQTAVQGVVMLQDVAVPATPAAGYGRIFVNSDVPQHKNDAGEVFDLIQNRLYFGAGDGWIFNGATEGYWYNVADINFATGVFHTMFKNRPLPKGWAGATSVVPTLWWASAGVNNGDARWVINLRRLADGVVFPGAGVNSALDATAPGVAREVVVSTLPSMTFAAFAATDAINIEFGREGTHGNDTLTDTGLFLAMTLTVS